MTNTQRGMSNTTLRGALQGTVGGRGRSRRLSVDSFLEGYFKSKIAISLRADEGLEQTFQSPPPHYQVEKILTGI